MSQLWQQLRYRCCLHCADVPWEQSSQSFTGMIVHHEETVRLQGLKQAVDSALEHIEASMDDASEDG